MASSRFLILKKNSSLFEGPKEFKRSIRFLVTKWCDAPFVSSALASTVQEEDGGWVEVGTLTASSDIGCCEYYIPCVYRRCAPG